MSNGLNIKDGIIFEDQTASPSNPDASKVRAFVKNGALTIRDSTGSEIEFGAAPTDPGLLQNMGLSTSVAASALTIALKQADGSTDATATAPIKIGIRESTVADGGYNVRSITAALSVVISSGSTLGHASAKDRFIYLYAIDNAGTIELAVSSWLFDDGEVHSTTAEGGAGAADDEDTLYSTTARSNVPIRLLARLKSNQTTAGTWAAVPTEASLAPYVPSSKKTMIRYRQFNGFGSTNTRVRRLLNLIESSGNDITLADSAANGTSLTFDKSGWATVNYTDQFDAIQGMGIVLNGTQGSTALQSITDNGAILAGTSTSAVDLPAHCSWSGYVRAGDVIWLQVSGGISGTNTIYEAFTISLEAD